jgi:hypothetical protein
MNPLSVTQLRESLRDARKMPLRAWLQSGKEWHKQISETIAFNTWCFES